ncbi:2-keto-4-pentenoate hydratase [Luedemannella helvata]
MDASDTHTRPRVDAAVERLRAALRDRIPCSPLTDLIDPDDVATAYAVQQRLTDLRIFDGATVVGRKIGLTSPAVQAQLGVNQPDFGVLFDDMAFAAGAELPSERLLQPRAEAEVAFVLGADLVDGPLEVADVRAAVSHVVAALEIVDSRIAGWDITFADTVADNASAGLYVLGSQRRTLAEVEPGKVEMRMLVDGDVVSTGNGAACLGDPLEALAWLARTAREFGEPLRAGQVVLSGALGPMYPVQPGARVTAEITGLGSVTTIFSGQEDRA